LNPVKPSVLDTPILELSTPENAIAETVSLLDQYQLPSQIATLHVWAMPVKSAVPAIDFPFTN
jgi:hypothetical protein